MNIYPSDVIDFDDPRLPGARAYVQTRFYPPLPTEYAEIGLAAVDLVNGGDDGENVLIIPEDTNPMPRGARMSEDGTLIEVDPGHVVDILRLGHLIEAGEW